MDAPLSHGSYASWNSPYAYPACSPTDFLDSPFWDANRTDFEQIWSYVGLASPSTAATVGLEQVFFLLYQRTNEKNRIPNFLISMRTLWKFRKRCPPGTLNSFPASMVVLRRTVLPKLYPILFVDRASRRGCKHFSRRPAS